MKKSLLVVVLALALMLALGATPAFAKYAGYSSTKQYVPWTEVQSLASLNPDAALMAQGPHKGYATTTIKCVVCHSVHRGTTTLLNSGTACAYCHAPVAEGGGAIASNLISWYTPAQGPHSSCGSTYCHGGPHGVNASIYDGPASKLLIHNADTELAALATANGVATSTFATYNATTRALATGAVCGRTGCHANSLFGVVTAGASKTVESGIPAPDNVGVTGHRVIAAATSTWNTGGTFPTTVTGTIAFAGVTYCNSCHDLQDDNNASKNAFPHGLTGVVDASVGANGTWRPAVWLTAGAYAGDPNRAAVGPYNQYNIGEYVTTTNGTTTQAGISKAAGSSILDGTCLKCHKGNAGASGLGINY